MDEKVTCPLCQGPKVDVELGIRGVNGSTLLLLNRPRNVLGLKVGKGTYVDAYVCTRCGHVSYFAHDLEFLGDRRK
jgi:hypothetical protein